MRVFKFLTILTSVCCFSGCIRSMEPYPESWPALNSPSQYNCSQFSGRYKALSKPGAHTAIQRSLSRLLLDEYIEETDLTWVDIEVNEREMTVTVGEGDRILENQIQNDFDCDDMGHLVRHVSDFGAAENIGPYCANNGYEFSKGADGALIAKETETAAALLLLIIPAGGRSVKWWRWEQLREAER